MIAPDDDHTADPPHEEPTDEGGGLPAVIAETVTAVATGIPPNAQRSLWKAFNRVLLAGVELPAKSLEGRARAAAARSAVEVAKLEAEASDIKARQKAREVVYRDSAKAAAAVFKDPEQAMRALDYHVSELARDQGIREDILLAAAEEVRANPPPQDSQTEIEDDWLYSFFREATRKSTDEYKQAFARILAGEIKAPGTFSIATVEALARLDAKTADLFLKACNISCAIGSTNARLISNFADPTDNSMEKYGLIYDDLYRLVEAGFLRSEFNETITLESILAGAATFLHIGGQEMLISRERSDNQTPAAASLEFKGPSFTAVSDELRRVVNSSPSEEYLNDLATWLATLQFNLYRNIRRDGGSVHGEKVEPVKPA